MQSFINIFHCVFLQQITKDMEHTPKPGSGQLFQNPVLEVLTKTPAFIAYTIYPAVGILLLVLSFLRNEFTLLSTVSVFIAGVLFWSLFEYMAHRYVFHWVSKMAGANRFVYTIHGVHHDYPKDKNRLIMPPIPWFILVLAVHGSLRLVMGEWAFAFESGMIYGYLAYIFVHYQVHTNNPPKFLKNMMIHHALHHYKYPNLAFGVSSTLWDRILGTMPPKDNKKK
jgi:sterol desaturase/sphingolipid hydroxylase (fatty acid hydroxylase superfamily)